jgi:hypothetical protein
MDTTAVNPRNDPVRIGVYRHYKHTDKDPKYYQVFGIGRHTNTEEKGVIYVPLYPAGGPRFAFRPLEDFISSVEVDGKTVRRFEYIGTEIPQFSV